MRVLLIAMCDSVHTAGWIRQFSGRDVKFVLFPSTPHRRIHRDIRGLMRSNSEISVCMRKTDRALAFTLGLLDVVARNRFRGVRLRRLIRCVDFDFIHILETQHGGYLYSRAMGKRGSEIPVALSLWGSDLSWFSRLADHHSRLRSTLAQVDHIFIECKRDISIAQDLGYKGVFSVPMPASGGLAEIRRELGGPASEIRPSKRRVIVVKGYTGFVGRARTALRVLGHLQDSLVGYTIHFYSVGLLMHWRLSLAKRTTSLHVVSHRKKSLTHSEMLELFSSARMSIALSASDGLPGSMREAAYCGAFPIESCGSCVAEWTTEGQGALIVDPADENSISVAIMTALTDDELVDGAVAVNQPFLDKISNELVSQSAYTEYLKLAQEKANSK